MYGFEQQRLDRFLGHEIGFFFTHLRPSGVVRIFYGKQIFGVWDKIPPSEVQGRSPH